MAHGLAAWAKLNNSHGLKSSISDWVYFSPHWKQMDWAVTAFCDFYFSVEYNQLTKKDRTKQTISLQRQNHKVIATKPMQENKLKM